MNDVNSPNFWRSVYQQGKTGWDLGGYTPTFCRLLDEGEHSPGKMIVLGAGRGYDARLFSRRGFTVTAVDFASEAVRDMHALAEKDAPVSIVHADMFNLPPFFNGSFDYVLEYTCFCAIDPARRGDYAEVVAGLLKPGGRFVGLAFPIGSYDGGPPFAVDPDQLVDLLAGHGLKLVRREMSPDSIESRSGREELIIMQKMPAAEAGPA
jgi:SAM-dependent methyltransferase